MILAKKNDIQGERKTYEDKSELILHPDWRSPPSPTRINALPPLFSQALMSVISSLENGSRGPAKTKTLESSSLSLVNSSLFLFSGGSSNSSGREEQEEEDVEIFFDYLFAGFFF